MAQKVKKEDPVPPKGEAKAKALETKKAALKGVHTSPTFQQPKTLKALKTAYISSEECTQEKQV